MATFAQLLARQQASQRLQDILGRTQLGTAAELEKQDIERARSAYETAVEEAERGMQKKAAKRSKWGNIGKAIGMAVTAFTPIGAVAGAALTAGLQYAGAESVGDYRKYIKGTLGDGLFFKQGRADFDADIASTNAFIKQAADSQDLANIYNALGTAISTYTQADALKSIGSEVKTLASDRFRDVSTQAMIEKDYNVMDIEGLLKKYGELKKDDTSNNLLTQPLSTGFAGNI